MLKFKNLKVYGAVGLIISSFALGGCGSKEDKVCQNEIDINGAVAYYYEATNSVIISEDGKETINGSSYRELANNCGDKINKFTLNNADSFNFSHLNTDISELSINIPNNDFDFTTLSDIKLEKLEVSFNKSANILSFFEYVKKSDLSNTDLSIKLLDLNSSILFEKELKNNTISASSVTIASEYTDFYQYTYNILTPDLKVIRIIRESGYGDIVMQLSNITENMHYEYRNDGNDLTVTINNLQINSNNQNLLVTIEKSNSLVLDIPEDAKIIAPGCTTLEINNKVKLLKNEE